MFIYLLEDGYAELSKRAVTGSVREYSLPFIPFLSAFFHLLLTTNVLLCKI